MKRMLSIGHATPRRGGAVIIVVLALMAMLAFLGFFFYDFVQIEQGSARNFSEIGDFDPGSDTLIETGLIQIISHTDSSKYPQSAMVGGKLSLRASVQGTMKDDGTGKYFPHDREIRNGRGIRVIPTTPPRFVYTGNDLTPNPLVGGTAATTPDLVLNRSGAANPAMPLGTALADTDSSYEPDVGYTYPDINSFWLAVDYLQNEDLDGNGAINGPEIDLNGDGQPNYARIIKPSFMDPDLFKAIETSTANWYQNAATQQWSLRPHAQHVVIGDTGQKRFISNRFPKINGATLALGPWTSNGEDYSGLDGDADGDGVLDSIYMDMGHPPMLGSNGRLVIPMFFWKIEDLNGLIDLNAAGNLASYHEKNLSGTIALGADIKDHQMGGSPRPVHYSHYGLSRAEVNPMWALSGNPATAGFSDFPWDTAFYRSTATTTYNRLQMQNTELAMVLLGSTTTLDGPVETTPVFFSNQSDDLAGRYGDPAQILTTASGSFSAPGVRGTDEDASEDANGNGMLDGGEDTNGNGILDGYLLPRGVHPTDSFGTGSIPINTSASGARDLSGGTYPLPRYAGAWQQQAVTANTYGTMVGSLVDTVLDLRRDDPGEVNRYSDLGANNDNLFEAYEVASLHLSDYDFSRSSLFSRVRQLAPFNFNLAKESNTEIGARDIRRQFTTESWNRREFSFAYDPVRDWEFNDADGSHRRFPPSFGGVASRNETGAPGLDLDPFRAEVRRLLTTRSIRSTPAPARNRAFFPQLPLELNRILDDQRASGSPAFDALGNPNFRQLTPHPNFRDASSPSGNIPAMYHGNIPAAVPVPFAARLSDEIAQEWWARYDRQRVARDIYVLLATLCAPGDPTDNVTTRGLEVLAPGLAKEFAQFAVNYVDAFDEDDTITRFEYDDNLADGWNPPGTLYVNGVEAQKLSINEVLWIKQKKAGTDVAQTYHNDADGHHQFLYVELHNDTAFQVDFQSDTWRLVRIDPTLLSMTPDLDVTTAANQMARVEFNSNKVVNGGANFVISSHDGNAKVAATTTVAPSDFYANAVGAAASDLEPIVPATGAAVAPGTNPPPAPLCDIDLCHPSHNGDYTMFAIDVGATSNTPATAKMLYFDDDLEDTTTTQMVLSLQRRRNLWTNGNITNLAESDWVEVDRFNLDFENGNRLEIENTGDEATELVTVKSSERFHPLDNRTDVAVDPGDLAPPQADRVYLANHSLNVPNSTATNTLLELGTLANTYARVWQPHHDRDLTSAYELITIPICSPAQVLGRLRDHSKGATVPGGINGWGNLGSFIPYSALTRFSPRAEASPPSPDVIPWSRLLNFVALTDPSDRVQRKLNPGIARTRTFGQLNINTIRSPSILAGVLDETLLLNPYLPSLPANAAFSDSRSWWNDLKFLRDGGNAQGMAGLRSRPFLPPGQFHTNPAPSPAPVHAAGVATEHGLLRHRYGTYPPTGTENDFGLFEARSLGDFGNDDVDLHTRNRLLQKLANNTTTRSHVFAIWGGVDFFDAEESSAGSGKYKVGAKATDIPTCRWFFVVDMSRLEDLQDLSWAIDWKKLIIHRQRLE